MMNYSRLASIIFDKGRKLKESEYEEVVSGINSDRLTLNEYVIEYKSWDAIGNSIFFELEDGKRVLIETSLLSNIRSLDLDHRTLLEFMSKSETNFKSVLKEMING